MTVTSLKATGTGSSGYGSEVENKTELSQQRKKRLLEFGRVSLTCQNLSKTWKSCPIVTFTFQLWLSVQLTLWFPRPAGKLTWLLLDFSSPACKIRDTWAALWPSGSTACQTRHHVWMPTWLLSHSGVHSVPFIPLTCSKSEWDCVGGPPWWVFERPNLSLTGGWEKVVPTDSPLIGYRDGLHCGYTPAGL